MIANRISIDEVIAQNGRLKLMKSMDWGYDKLPHMLIAGGTGGGKTYFILTLIETLLKTNAKLYFLDSKKADLTNLNTIMPDVYYKKEDMIARSEEMKQMEGYKTGENYAYLGLDPHFLVFDEYVVFMEMLASKESTAVLTKLKQIFMLGRQAGIFLILACQRPDAKYLGDEIRNQFNFRVALGRMSELGYGMMFGSDMQKQFFLKQIKGRGYVNKGDNVISEFYTPIDEVIDRFDRYVFESVVDNVIVGGVDEDGNKDPAMITFVYETGLSNSLDGEKFKPARRNAKKVNTKTSSELCSHSSDDTL